MVDSLTPAQRSQCMAAIRGRDTRPEMAVRSLVHAMGFRYRLHGRNLPGTPDLVFRARKKIIFVHGCFWHTHSCPRGQLKPATNSDFWSEKRTRTVRRDALNSAALKKKGWKVLTIWECQLRSVGVLSRRIVRFLDGAGPSVLHVAKKKAD
jgi:DNA mismatch endonuclease (patch repair protein)